MKLTTFLFFITVLQVFARGTYSQNTKLTLDLKETTVEQVLREIENQSEFYFLFNQKLVDINRRINLQVTEKKIDDILAQVFYGTNVDYIVIDRQIVLSPAEYLAEVKTRFQPITITGTLTDENGEPLPGVSISLKGTTRGTVTNLEGEYTIEVEDPSTTVLVFSFIGYLTREITIGDQTTLNVTMTPDLIGLEEVVVIGYGKMKRVDLTGSVGSVDADVIMEVNRTNAYATIQGQIPGLVIQSIDNKPGGGFTIRIRGANTINSQNNSTLGIRVGESVDHAGFIPGENPLFIVDGIFMNDINFLNPSDIARMDVLKDASATAIYGSRGSKGVIIIQTKKGSTGAISVEYNGSVGLRQAYNLPEIFEGEEFVQFFNDATVGIHYATGDFGFTRDDVVLSDYLRPNEMINIANGDYTDWVDLMNQNGLETNHSLSLSGGSEKTVYGFGAAYTFNEGNFEGEDYERFNIRGDVNSEVTPWLTLGYNNYVSYSIRNEGSYEGFRSCYRLRPTGSPYDENGDPLFFPLQGETFITNPLFEPDNMTQETAVLNYLGNLSLVISPIDNLSFTSSFAPNLINERYGEYAGLYSKTTTGQQAATRAVVTNLRSISYTWDNIINYDRELNDNHSINGTFIYSMFSDNNEKYIMNRRNFSTDKYLFYNIDAGSEIRSLTSSYSKQTLESFTGRLHYSYKQKYLFTVTGRYDGSSILSEENKWAFFPSAAFAWRLTEENFMNNQTLFSNLKLRLSYGQTGSNGSGGGLQPLSSQSLIGNGFTNLGDEVVQTAYVTGLANQDLTWEKTKETNIGLDFGLFRNRINGSLDVYNRQNTDIIFFRPMSTASGYTGVFENIGEAYNRGVEFALNTVNVTGSNFRWTTSLNFAKNKNEVTKLYGDLDIILFSTQSGSNAHKIGEPVGSIYTYIWDGIWQMDEMAEAQSYNQQPGQIKVKDLNNDGVIDANDRTVIGVNMPAWTGGITNSLNYKNIDFSFFIYTNQGAKSFSWFHRSHGWDQDNRPARFNGLKTNYWTPDNPTNDWYQPGNSGPYKQVTWYYDVSFIKVGYITLGYNLPKQTLNKLNMGRLRVYLTVQNPFTFTDYEGWDPENAARNSWGSAYMSRVFMAGVNVNFNKF